MECCQRLFLDKVAHILIDRLTIRRHLCGNPILACDSNTRFFNVYSDSSHQSVTNVNTHACRRTLYRLGNMLRRLFDVYRPVLYADHSTKAVILLAILIGERYLNILSLHGR